MQDLRQDRKAQIAAGRISGKDDARSRSFELGEDIVHRFDSFNDLCGIRGVRYKTVFKEEKGDGDVVALKFGLYRVPKSEMRVIAVERKAATYDTVNS